MRILYDDAGDGGSADVLTATDCMQTLNLEGMFTVLKFEQRIVVWLAEHSLEFVHELCVGHTLIQLNGLDQCCDLSIVRHGEDNAK